MKAICIGGATVDSLATIDSDSIERMSMLNAGTAYLLLQEGHKTEAVDIATHCGGGAINAAVALARLGIETSVLAKVGRDPRADVILSRLQSEGVSPRWVIRDQNAPTGASVIISSHEHNAAVFTFRGANALLAPADVPDEALAADLVYIAALSGNSADCLIDIIGRAAASSALIAVNASARYLASRAHLLLGKLSAIDVLAVNRREAEALLPALLAKLGESVLRACIHAAADRRVPLSRNLTAGDYELSVPAFLAALYRLGARRVLLTDGREGAFVGDRGKILYCPAETAIVASTAGAGDAITATFAAFIALGYADDLALKAATINAASVVTRVDTQSGLLRREEIERRLGMHPESDLQRLKI